jgi:TPR repeat protein
MAASALAQTPSTPSRSGAGADATELSRHPELAQSYQDWTAGQYEHLLARLEPLARAGDAMAQFFVGSFYSRGEGVLQDDEVAVSWWRKAAEQGLARAQNELGTALTDGRGIEPDPVEAVAWFRRAAAQDLAVAQANLGLMYWNGLGVNKDNHEAIALFRMAASKGLGWAQYYLGEAYARGQGVTRDPDQAIDWYLLAAEQDYTEAQYALGAMYLNGRIVRRNTALSVVWLSRAARGGHEAAAKAIPVALSQLPRRHLRAPTEVRQQPAADSQVIRIAANRELAYRLSRTEGWTEVYLTTGHTVGYIRDVE